MNSTATQSSVRRFRILSLDQQRVRSIRENRIDSFGGVVEVRKDPHPHQCRVCLEPTAPNEEYLLFSHSPFDHRTPYAERGPVFIHARDCVPYQATDEFPPAFPRDIVLRAYSEQGGIVDAGLSDGADLEELAADLLSRPAVAYLHARNRSYGCFMYRVEAA